MSSLAVEFALGRSNSTPHSGELFKLGQKLNLHGQPIEVLSILLEHPGELITREEFCQRLWPQDTFVDFEHSLNTAIKKLRQTLDDDPDAPHYIETLPKKGYRFIAQVEAVPNDVVVLAEPANGPPYPVCRAGQREHRPSHPKPAAGQSLPQSSRLWPSRRARCTGSIARAPQSSPPFINSRALAIKRNRY